MLCIALRKIHRSSMRTVHVHRCFEDDSSWTTLPVSLVDYRTDHPGQHFDDDDVGAGVVAGGVFFYHNVEDEDEREDDDKDQEEPPFDEEENPQAYLSKQVRRYAKVGKEDAQSEREGHRLRVTLARGLRCHHC